MYYVLANLKTKLGGDKNNPTKSSADNDLESVCAVLEDKISRLECEANTVETQLQTEIDAIEATYKQGAVAKVYVVTERYKDLLHACNDLMISIVNQEQETKSGGKEAASSVEETSSKDGDSDFLVITK